MCGGLCKKGLRVSLVTCIFGEFQKGRVKVKGTLAKMARGEMVRWLSQNQMENLEDVKAFRELGYAFVPELSTEKEYVFLNQTVMGLE